MTDQKQPERICRTCRYWKEESYFTLGTGGRRTCTLTDTDHYKKDTGEYDYAYPESKAHAYGEHGYDGILVTAPDFGCNQWEERIDD